MLILALAAATQLTVVSGRATIYYPNDGQCGTHRADGKRFRKKDFHIAHRWLPLGTEGYLCNLRTHKCVKTVVRDRGPFGALRRCKHGDPGPYTVRGKTFKSSKIRWMGRCHYWQAQPVRLRPGFKYRGEFDLTRPVAKAIGHKAFDIATFFYNRSSKRWNVSAHQLKRKQLDFFLSFAKTNRQCLADSRRL